jgi:hypothetical protein
MTMAVALISAFPEETREDLRDTIHYYVNSRRYDNAEPQLSLLAPLAQTPIHSKYKDQIVFDSIFSDMSHQGWQQDPTELEMIKANPTIFPNFYALPTNGIPREYFSNVRNFVMAVTTWFRWLPIALLQDSEDFLEVFDKWIEWREQQILIEDAGPVDNVTPYYNQRQFALDFIEFVRTCYISEMARAPHVIASIVASEGMFEPNKRTVPEVAEDSDPVGFESYPFQPEGLNVIPMEVDYRELLDCLRKMRSLDQVPKRKVSVAFRLTDQSEVEVRQLTSLSTELLSLCNGTRNVEDIIHHFAQLKEQINEIAVEKVCIFGLKRLSEQNLIAFSPRQLSVEM